MLGQPIDRFALQIERLMFVPVPCLVGLGAGEAEVGRHVDELDLRVVGEDRLRDLLGRPMRQPAEQSVDVAPIGILDGRQIRKIGETEMREDFGHRLAGVTVRRQNRDLHDRVAKAEADKVGAGVA